MSVRFLLPHFNLNLVKMFNVTDRIPGYVKEESLRSIVQWFDFWLSQ